MKHHPDAYIAPEIEMSVKSVAHILTITASVKDSKGPVVQVNYDRGIGKFTVQLKDNPDSPYGEVLYRSGTMNADEERLRMLAAVLNAMIPHVQKQRGTIVEDESGE